MSNERFKIISFTDEEFRAATGHDVEPPDFWDEWEITTRDFIDPDPECDLDYVPNTAREVPVDVALSVGSGFGGFQSAMIFSKPDFLDR